MLSLRERMELDLEARLMGETLVLNRSLDSFSEDYIELNDLNKPFELRRNQGDNLVPTIEEGKVIEEFRTSDENLDGIDDYPSYCDDDKKIHIDCAHNLKRLLRFDSRLTQRFASRPHCVLLQDLTAFCFKTSLRFASSYHCVLLKTSIAFCLKTILRFDKKLLWQNFIHHCVLLQHHCVLLKTSIAFCLKTILRFDKQLLWQNFILHCVLSRLLHCVLPKGKENGLQILQSIDQGPFELGTTRDALGTTPEGGVLLGPERPHTYEDLSDTEKKRYDADVRATNIVLQGLPKDIYKLINHNIEAKAIWDNVKMLLAGSELTKEDRESQLYDEFERFKMLPGENINEYYVRFHKLVNDMRNIRMTMPNIQLNSKFVNNMSPEWDRRPAGHKNRLIIERITPATNDQLAFVSTVQPHAQSSHVQSHQYPSSSTNLQSPQYPQFPETSQIDSGYTQTDEILDNLTKQMALLAQSFRATLPQTNNQLRISSNTRNQATIQDGRVVIQNVQGRHNQNQRYFAQGNGTTGNGVHRIEMGMPMQPKRPHNSNYFNDKMLLMQAQENGAVLDEDELLFLADVDDEPTAQSIFMANLSSVGNVIPYEQYVSVNDILAVPSCASSALNSVCVSLVNDAVVPHDPIAIELKIYKEQVAIYEQRAKFELTEREQ
ncbi:hypothetical protein Tco_0794075 [Tanacetum coccineum]